MDWCSRDILYSSCTSDTAIPNSKFMITIATIRMNSERTTCAVTGKYCGFSTSRIYLHVDKHGKLVPGTRAAGEDVVEGVADQPGVGAPRAEWGGEDAAGPEEPDVVPEVIDHGRVELGEPVARRDQGAARGEPHRPVVGILEAQTSEHQPARAGVVCNR